MSANIKVSGKTYNGIETVSVKNTDNDLVDFLLQGVTPPTKNYGFDYVTFIDYDGSIVISYSKEEFLALSAMPANPSHTGLASEGWNWTLSDAKTYVTNNGELIIGQMYATASGKTEYDVEINEATGFIATLNNNAEKDWGDGTIDNSTTHTYSAAGSYTIKLGGTSLPNVMSSKKLRAVRIAGGVTLIDTYTFQGCRALTEITIPSSVVEFYSVSDCRALKCVVLPSGVLYTSNSAFGQCYSLQYISLPNSIGSLPLFNSCLSLQRISIPSSITVIFGNTFTNCAALQSVTIPSSVVSIGGSAFHSCNALLSIRIPNSITEIGDMIFNSCYSLQSVSIAEGVEEIGNSSFAMCSALQEVTIPSSVTNIHSNAFNYSDWLKVVIILALTPPTLEEDNAFPSSVEKIYIPHGTLSAYQSATNWSTYSSLFVELHA